MNNFDETASRLDESKRYASLYYHAAVARFDTLRELMTRIESAGGVENARQPLSDAAQAALDLAENLRHSHMALRQLTRDKRDPRERA